VRFAREKEADPSLDAQAQELLQRWEQGDPEVVGLWRTMNGWVERGFEETYRRLGVAFDRIYHESETYGCGRDAVLEALAQGRCYRLPDGAVEIDLTDDGLDKKILLKRDGTSMYITQDLGTALLRVRELCPDRMYYVVGSEQIYHFKVLFATLRRFGHAWAERCRHISYGMVYLPEGKMKSREGKVVDADDLLDEVEALSAAAVREKHPDIAPDELAVRQRQIALGAIKFYLLNVNVEKDITFDPAASVSFEGDTGPYVQYAHTRICGILRKAAERAMSEPDFGQLGTDDELVLGRLLMQFPRAVADAAESCNPAKVAGHVLALARAFTQFYHDQPVLQAESPGLAAARLELCRAAAAVLQQSLALLGIEAPEQM
jgi:arginyl-tRNA synthetase